MRRFFSRALIVAAALPFTLHAAGEAPPAPPVTGDSPLLAPDAVVGGLTQAQWSQRWWEWAGSFEYQDSPVADRTGANCAAGQSGDVWFLAGTYGTQRTVRTCRVPAGKHLFFPIINYVVFPPSRGPVPSCFSMMSEAARITQRPQALMIDIDGVRHQALHAHRQATRECFDLGARTETRTKLYPSAANGYYVMLQPLPAGRHTIEFVGILPSMTQGVTYTLIVE